MTTQLKKLLVSLSLARLGLTILLSLVISNGLLAQSTNWVGGTNLLNTAYGLSSDSDVVDGATLIVTNGGSLTAGLVNVGPTNRATLTLLTNAAITVQQLLATNVIIGGVTNSILNFGASGTGSGTLITSNGTGSSYAFKLLLASNAWTFNGNWAMNGGTNLFSNAATNGGASQNNSTPIYVGNGFNNAQVSVNTNAVLWLAVPTNSMATNIPSLIIGYGNATNNVVTINNGTVIITNNIPFSAPTLKPGQNIPITLGSSVGSFGNQLLVTNGARVFLACRRDAGVQGLYVGSAGSGNSVIVAGTNAAGQKAMINMFTERLQTCNNVAGTNNWVRVDQGGVISNATIMMYNNFGYLYITNGGQFYAGGITIGRIGFNSGLVVGGADSAGNKALLYSAANTMVIGGGSVSVTSGTNPGTNCFARVEAGGLITNVTSINSNLLSS
ncbi:MAG: hypothetical protein WCO56_19925 [Verrucomicrobiota bacterium]